MLDISIDISYDEIKKNIKVSTFYKKNIFFRVENKVSTNMTLQRCFRFLTILHLMSVWLVFECQADVSGHHIDASRSKHRNGVHRTDIYFAAFFPMGTKTKAPEGSIGHGVMPAVRLAIKHINQSPNILRGYKLHMYWNDTEVSFLLTQIQLYFVSH